MNANLDLLELGFHPYFSAMEESNFDRATAMFYPSMHKTLDATVTEQLEYIISYFIQHLEKTPDNRKNILSCAYELLITMGSGHRTHRTQIEEWVGTLLWEYPPDDITELSDLSLYARTVMSRNPSPAETLELLSKLSPSDQKLAYAWFFMRTLSNAYKRGMMLGDENIACDLEEWLSSAPTGTWTYAATLHHHAISLPVHTTGQIYLTEAHIQYLSQYPGVLTYFWSFSEIIPKFPECNVADINAEYIDIKTISQMGLEVRMFYALNYALPDLVSHDGQAILSLTSPCKSCYGITKLTSPFYAFLMSQKDMEVPISSLEIHDPEPL